MYGVLSKFEIVWSKIYSTENNAKCAGFVCSSHGKNYDEASI